MHFGTELNQHANKKKASKIIQTMKGKACAAAAFLFSVALVIGLVPIISPDNTLVETNAAQVAHRSFEGKTKAEVEEMMKHMTIDEIVDAMPLKDKVSQLFVTYSGDIYSGTASSPMGSYTSLNVAGKNRLAEYPVGGVCYFLSDISNQSQIQSVSKSFQESNKYGMFLAVDEEGGRVQRIGGTTYSGAVRGAGIGTQVNAMYTYKDQGTSVAKSNAQALANNLLMTGMNWDFAPVADTNSNPSNPIIGDRAYSNDYNQTAQLITAAIEGFQSKNVMTSLKHFPGHGDTSTDSHAGAALVNKKIDQLMNEDLIPFIAGIEAGADSIMLGHLSYVRDDGSLSSSINLIAPNSKEIVTNLLRERLGYNGLVITDGLMMGAVTKLYGTTGTSLINGHVTGKKYNGYITAAIDFFDAGGDMFLLCGDPYGTIEALMTEINAGTISESRLDESVSRVMEAKRKYGIIPAYDDSNEATYIGSNGTTSQGTFAEMWARAVADNGVSPAPVVRLNKDVAASATGSFGRGTGIAANGDLTVPAGHSVTLDLNGHTLNKNLSESTSAANKHIFNIPENATITIHDSSDDQNGRIIGANGTTGTVAYASGTAAKFIMDSGIVTESKGTSLIYADASAVLRLGIQDAPGNNAGPISITGNNTMYAIDFSGAMYLMGETVIKDNGGANLYFNGSNSTVNIQDRGLAGGNGSIGITVSNERAANTVLMKAVGDRTQLTGSDLNAVFYDTDDYQLELNTTINLIKADGDVRFVSSDGSINDSGTWDEMFTKYVSKQAGTLTLLRDISLTSNVANPAWQQAGNDSPYRISFNTVIDLNGKKLDISTNARNLFQVMSNAELTINDARTPYVTKEKVNQAGVASFDENNDALTVYIDEYDGAVLSTMKTTYDFAASGLITMRSTNNDVDGAIDLISGKVVMNGGGLNCNGNGRAIAVKTGTSFTMNDGFLFNGTSAGHAASVWVFGDNASATINGGVIAANKALNSASGSSGALGLYFGNAKATITGGIFTGNESTANHGGAVSMANNAATTSLVISGGTFCHNSSVKNGGAIYVNSSSTTNISNALITSNTAQNGGGLYMNGTSKVSLSGTTSIIGNTAAVAGGIYNATSNALDIKDALSVKDNTAAGKQANISVVSNGNTVALSGPLTSPISSVGIDVPSAAAGTKIAVGSGYTPTASDAGKFFIDNMQGIFATASGNNVLLEEGEARYVSSDGNTVKNGDFKTLWDEQFAKGADGTITLMRDVSLSVSSSLTTNSTNATLDLNGYVLSLATNGMANTAPIIVKGGTFSVYDANEPSLKSEAINAPAGAEATWDENSKELVYYTTTHEDFGTITEKHVANLSSVGAITYTSCGADPDGIIRNEGGATLKIQGGRLTSTNSRAIQNVAGSKLIVNNGYIVGNNNAAIGGAILNLNDNTTCNITGGVIAGNSGSNGGAIWMHSTVQTLNISGGVISGNKSTSSTAKDGGGAIFVNANYKGTVNITGGLITHNTAVSNGGGIAFMPISLHSGLNIHGATISANKTAKNGGGVYSQSNINDPDSHIDKNEAAQRGGGIYTTAGLIADNLCVSENSASESGGIFATLETTLRGNITIDGNTANGVQSNLDVTGNSSTVTISGALAPASKIGLTIAKTNERNQKVVFSAIALDDSYSSIFYDDANENHILRFNGDSDGLWLIQEDKAGDELGAGTPSGGFTVVNQGKIHRQAANMSWSGGANTQMQHILVGTGNNLTGNFGAWCRYILTLDTTTGKYKCTQIVPQDTTNWPNTAITLATNQVMLVSHASGNIDPSLSLGDYVDFDFVPTTTEKSSTAGIGNYTVYSYDEGPEEVNYKIHYIHHYPVSDLMTNEYYVEYDSKEMTGVVGQLAYIPYNETVGYLESDSHNVISKTLQADGASGINWYFPDETLTHMIGADDSVNDLYIVFEHSQAIFEYKVDYYDVDTGELIQSIDRSAASLPISATDQMKSLDGYSYVPTADTVDEITDIIEGEIPTMKLYFKKHGTYRVEYVNDATGATIGFSDEFVGQAAGEEVQIAADAYGRTEAIGYDSITGSKDITFVSNSEGQLFKKPDNAPTSFTMGDDASMTVKISYTPLVKFNIVKKEYKENGTWEAFNNPYPCLYAEENQTVTAVDAWKKHTGYLFVPSGENVLSIEVGVQSRTRASSNATNDIVLCFIKTSTINGSPKPQQDNQLTPIERASTKDFINIELFDYGRAINTKSTLNNKYPIFKGAPLSTENDTENPSAIGNLGETVQYDAEVAQAGMSMNYNTANVGDINKLAASSVDSRGANAAINGFSKTYVGGESGASKNPIGSTLSADGSPVLNKDNDNVSLSYLFADSSADGDTYNYETRKIASNIDGLFDYNPETGYYSYSSVKNHAEYNSETNTFDVYDAIVTPNVSDYIFGNFMPFTNINKKTTQVNELGHDYMMRTAEYARYKSNHEDDPDLKKRYSLLDKAILSADSNMTKKYGQNYTYKEFYEYYFGNNKPNNAVNPQDCFYNPIRGVGSKYFESPEDFYDSLYMIDYDEIKNFFFGITFDFDFIMPADGEIGENRNEMIFDFEGDDDVLIYIDDKLFLNLAGIHRQVGGQINFSTGEIQYRDFNYNKGITENASYLPQPGYSKLNEGKVTFREVLTDAGLSQGEIDNLLNEEGTFKDWTGHSFKMFYMERGSGSGVLRLNFNLPAIPRNTLLVAKNITNENHQPILSDPFFNMQLVKCDENGKMLRGENNEVLPYLAEGTEYMIYEDGIFTGRTRTVDSSGIITLRANQFAVVSNYAQPDDVYLVRELIDSQYVNQFNWTTITNNTVFGGEYTSNSTTNSSTSANAENSVTIDGRTYLVRSSYPMRTDGTNLSSTLFENHLDLQQLGALAIKKNIIEGDTAWNQDDVFNFMVTLDGKPISKTTASNTETTYYVYKRAADGSYSPDGNGKLRKVESDGIISIKANEVAVLRYMLAGSQYQICEVDNPNAGGIYHPVYNKDDNGDNIYSGYIETGSFNKPVEFEISNQRAENLTISKIVENVPESDMSFDYAFDIEIKGDNRHIDDTYEYEIFDMTDEKQQEEAETALGKAELPDLDSSKKIANEYALSGNYMNLNVVKAPRQTVTFKDHVANISLKANQRIIIYGLPYGCTYTVVEKNANEYATYYKGMNHDGYTEGKAAEFVLDASSTDIGKSNTVEFKNSKIGTLSISKELRINGSSSILYGKYSEQFASKFTFYVSAATSDGSPFTGTLPAVVTSTYDTENKCEFETPATSNIDVSFTDGSAEIELSHGQTVQINKIPYGALCEVKEKENPAYTTSYKIGGSEPSDGTSTGELEIAPSQSVSYINELITSGLPSTGGVGLIVVALALVGGAMFLISFARYRKKIGSKEGDDDIA